MSNHRNRKRAIELLERVVNISPDQEIKLSREDIWAIRIGLDSLKLDEVYGLEYLNYDLEYFGLLRDCISRESALLCLTGENLPEDLKDYISLVSKRLRELPNEFPKNEVEK